MLPTMAGFRTVAVVGEFSDVLPSLVCPAHDRYRRPGDGLGETGQSSSGTRAGKNVGVGYVVLRPNHYRVLTFRLESTDI